MKTRFEIYADKKKQFRWRLVHRNGNILADSGESYTRKSTARRAIIRIQLALATTATIVETDK